MGKLWVQSVWLIWIFFANLASPAPYSMLLLPRWPPHCSLDEAQAKAKEESSPSSSGSSSSSTYNCLYRCAKLYSYAYDNSRRASLYSRRTADGLCSRTYDDCCTCAISLCSDIRVCSSWHCLRHDQRQASLLVRQSFAALALGNCFLRRC